jgi:Skp family chaperone for outer membrane proteins
MSDIIKQLLGNLSPEEMMFLAADKEPKDTQFILPENLHKMAQDRQKVLQELREKHEELQKEMDACAERADQIGKKFWLLVAKQIGVNPVMPLELSEDLTTVSYSKKVVRQFEEAKIPVPEECEQMEKELIAEGHSFDSDNENGSFQSSQVVDFETLLNTSKKVH